MNTPALETKLFTMIKSLNGYLKHFPRDEKFALVKDIKNVAYELVILYAKAKKQYQNKTTLQNLDITLETLRLLTRVAFEMRYFNFYNGRDENTDSEALRKYTYLANQFDEIGSIIGSWLKNTKG